MVRRAFAPAKRFGATCSRIAATCCSRRLVWRASGALRTPLEHLNGPAHWQALLGDGPECRRDYQAVAGLRDSLAGADCKWMVSADMDGQ